MHKPHLALSNRPEPEQLARRWFEYLLAGIVVAIMCMLALMSSPDRAPNPAQQDEPRIGTLARAPAEAPHSAPAN